MGAFGKAQPLERASSAKLRGKGKKAASASIESAKVYSASESDDGEGYGLQQKRAPLPPQQQQQQQRQQQQQAPRPARGGDEEYTGGTEVYDLQPLPSTAPPPPPAAPPASLYNPTYVATDFVIGRGGFGVVHHGVHQATGEEVAVKEFSGNFALDQHLIGGILSELAMLEKLQHPQIVALKGHHVDREAQRALIYLEYVSGGSLSSLMEKNGGRLFEALIRRLARDAVTGLLYLHKQDVVHRDIKPHNLLIASNGRVKVADFGCCKEICDKSSSTHTMVGTPRYMAPEAVHGKVSPASDMWSMGATITELASGEPPWREKEQAGGQVALIFHIGMGMGRDGHHPTIPTTLSPEAVKALQKCFASDPNQRYTTEDFLASDFLSNVDVPLAGQESIEAYNEARSKSVAGKTPAVMDVATLMTVSFQSSDGSRPGYTTQSKTETTSDTTYAASTTFGTDTTMFTQSRGGTGTSEQTTALSSEASRELTAEGSSGIKGPSPPLQMGRPVRAMRRSSSPSEVPQAQTMQRVSVEMPQLPPQMQREVKMKKKVSAVEAETLPIASKTRKSSSSVPSKKKKKK